MGINQVLRKGDELSHSSFMTYPGVAFGTYLGVMSAKDLLRASKNAKINKASTLARLVFGLSLAGFNANVIYQERLYKQRIA